MAENKTTKVAAFNNFHPVAVKRASEAIYEQVKSLIIKGELNPGDRLPSERNMMEMFQRSRPTVREALRMLERTGYIYTIPGSNGAIVRTPDNKNIQQTMKDALQLGNINLEEMSEYRKISEAATAMWAAQRGTAEDMAALQDLLNQMETDIRNEEYDKFIDLDMEFHGLIAKAAKNQVSIVMNKTFSELNRTFIKNKVNKLQPSGQKKMITRIYNMHKAIFEALQERDAEKAQKAMEEHLDAFEND